MTTHSSSARPRSSRVNWKRLISILVALIAFAIPFVHEFEGLSAPGHRVLSVFFLAIVLWVSEAVPMHATAAIVILLQILLVSDKGLIKYPAEFKAPAFRLFYNSLSDPILMLFLGGFFLADGASKYRLDRNLARVLLKPFGTSPKMILMGLMLITATLSMFMSNTATTAAMMAVVLPVIAQLPAGDRLKAGLALSIPVAANIGGMGTPIGTPPNAIALGALAKAGIQIGFMKWVMMVFPFMVIILFFAWILLARMFPCSKKEINLTIRETFDTSWPAKIFYFTFALTILLWFTEELHGISSNIVGFVPVVILLSTRVFTVKDFQSVEWHVLWLVAGGIALGTGIGATKMDTWFIGLFSWDKMGPTMLIAMLCLASLFVGTFISHSATANLLVPIGMSLAMSDAVSISPVMAAIFIALGSSIAMALPISTPPNAIAMSTGTVTTRDMAISGVIIGIVGWVLFSFLAPPVWNLLGIMPK